MYIDTHIHMLCILDILYLHIQIPIASQYGFESMSILLPYVKSLLILIATDGGDRT